MTYTDGINFIHTTCRLRELIDAFVIQMCSSDASEARLQLAALLVQPLAAHPAAELAINNR